MNSVTVYIPTKNRASLVRRAITSVQLQTHENWRCIVVDDGSTDNTSFVIQEFASDSRIEYIRLDEPRGACAARNLAILSSDTEFVTGLDDDDMFLPNRLQDMITEIGSDQAIGSQDIIINEQTAFKTKRFNFVNYRMIERRNCVGNQLLMRRKFVRSMGGYDEGLTSNQDYDLWLRIIAEIGELRLVDKPGQIISDFASDDRITTNAQRRVAGYDAFIKKHQHRMSNKALAHHFNCLSMLRGDRPVLAKALLGFEFSNQGIRDFAKTICYLLKKSG